MADPYSKVVAIQYYLAFSGQLGAFVTATVWSYSSTALPSLRMDSQMGSQVSQVAEDWIASITFLAGAIGYFACGFLAQNFGLKRSLQIIALPLVIGWIIVAAAQNVSMLIAGRFITGFCVAGVGVSCSIVAELADRSRRGRLNVEFDLMFCVGVLFIYITGMFLSWRFQAASCAGVALLWFGLLYTIPESPHSLYNKGDFDKATKALTWARSLSIDTSEFGNDNFKNNLNVTRDSIDSTITLNNFRTLVVWKPILVTVALHFFLQFSGIVPIVCYAVDVFRLAVGNNVLADPYVAMIGVVNLGATYVACLCVDKVGRRKLMMGSEACLVLVLFTFGVFLYLRDRLGVEPLQYWEWFPGICFTIYMTGFSFGVGTIPWVISGEVLHQSARGFSNGVVIVLTRIFGFITMFYFKLAITALGHWGVYWFFATICLFGLIFAYLFLPETKGLTLKQIEMKMQEGWLQNKSSNSNSNTEGTEFKSEDQQANVPIASIT